jgi:2-methylcitrate dehydratase PrpD
VIAARLGAFAAALQPADLPAEVLAAAKLRVLDTLGAGLAGMHLGHYDHVAPLLDSAGPVQVWGRAEGRSPREAALANSFVAHATYLEDGSRFTGGHPSSVVIPAALALAQAKRSDGPRLLAAIVAGYEVFLRLGRAIYPATVTRGFQSTAVLGAVSSAATAASLARLSPAAAGHAIAIACNLGVGLKEALKRSASQPIQVGRSCEGGLVAATMAERGLEGAPQIIEMGFLPAFAGTADTASIVAGLGREFRIGETYLKRHAGCRGNHAPVDAAIEWVKANGIRPRDVSHVVVGVDTVTRAAAIEPPANAEQAQFSIGFSVAMALLAGDASIFRYTDAVLAAPETREMMERIDVRVDRALDAGYPERRGATLAVTLADGRSLKHRVDNARGEPEWPLTREDVEEKFLALATPTLGARAKEVLSAVDQLDAMGDVTALSRLLAPAEAA